MSVKVEIKVFPDLNLIKEKIITFDREISVKELMSSINLSPNGVIATINGEVVPDNHVINSDVKITFVMAAHGG